MFLHRYEGILTCKRHDKYAGRNHECRQTLIFYSENWNEQNPHKKRKAGLSCPLTVQNTSTRSLCERAHKKNQPRQASLINTFEYANVSWHKKLWRGWCCTIPVGADTTGSKQIRGGRTRKRRVVSPRQLLGRRVHVAWIHPSVGACGGLTTQDFSSYKGLFFWLRTRISQATLRLLGCT